MKRKLLKSLLIIACLTAVLLSCVTNKVKNNKNCNIERRQLQFKFLDTNGHGEIKLPYQGYSASYDWLLDSLKLSNVDTIALFIRPCFTHRGIVFRFEDRVTRSYYFNFSKQNREVVALENNCDMARNYFNFLAERIGKNITADTVLIIPDCPVDFFIRAGPSSFYGNISGSDIAYYSSASISFKALMRQSDSVNRRYTK